MPTISITLVYVTLGRYWKFSSPNNLVPAISIVDNLIEASLAYKHLPLY
jgi:hypothetical protein